MSTFLFLTPLLYCLVIDSLWFAVVYITAKRFCVLYALQVVVIEFFDVVVDCMSMPASMNLLCTL